MINGAHAIVFSTDADADRAFLRDVLALPHVDVGEGWLIFGLPPAEVAVHPADETDGAAGNGGSHELYLMCENVEQLRERLSESNIESSDVSDQGWGLVTQVTLPGGSKLGIYEPRHARPEQVTSGARGAKAKKAKAPRLPKAKKAPKAKAGKAAKPAQAAKAAKAAPKAAKKAAKKKAGKRKG
jgi:hypothetical protein